ncbi:MAG: hypothetical protein AAF402_07000 [Pseudomonadota bacterium]
MEKTGKIKLLNIEMKNGLLDKGLFRLCLCAFVLFGSLENTIGSDDYESGGEFRLGTNHDKIVDSRTLVEFRKEFYGELQRGGKWDSLPDDSKSLFWSENEARLIRSALGHKKFDLIVVPVQQSIISLDKTARLTISRIVAEKIAAGTSNSVMPVELFHRVVGDQLFRFGDIDVVEIERQYGAQNVLSLYVRESRSNKEKLDLAAVLHSDDRIIRVGAVQIEKPKSDKSLMTVSAIPSAEIAAKIFQIKEFDSELTNELKTDFPKSLQEMELKSNPAQTALNFQILGLLTPEISASERRRFFERSLVALNKVSESLPLYDVLKARALFYLYRRPEAVSIISNNSSIEAQAIKAFLDGNYYELERIVSELQPGVFRAFSYIEKSRLADRYEIVADIDPLEWVNENWREMIHYASEDNDKWSTRQNFEYFYAIEGLFPLFDEVYQKVMEQKQSAEFVQGEYDESDIAFDSAINRLVKNGSGEWCCSLSDATLSRLDIIRFYRTLGISNVLRQLDKRVNQQAHIESSNRMLVWAESLLDGHRTYLRIRSQLLALEIERASPTTRPNLLKKLYEFASLSANTGGITDEDRMLSRDLIWDHHRNYRQEYKPERQLMDKISDVLGDWPTNIKVLRSYNGVKDYQYTNYDFRLIRRAHRRPGEDDDPDAILEEIKSRFDGHPEKHRYLSQVLEKNEGIDEALSYMERAINSGDKSWDLVELLASKYLRRGEYDKAAETYMRFPGFSGGAVKDRVRLSNQAYVSGSEFYWKGEYELARPLYEISANLETGSHASITSAQRLAQLEGDYLNAARYAQRAASRYSSFYRYRDFLSYLHLFGFSQDADATFYDLSSKSNDPNIWSAYLIGNRVRGSNLDQIVDDLLSHVEVHETLVDRAKRYIIMHVFTDRRVDDAVLQQTDKIFSRFHKYKDGITHRKIRKDSLIIALAPDIREQLISNKYEGAKLMEEEYVPCSEEYIACINIHNREVSDKYEIFIQAISDIQNDKYDAALEKFIKYVLFYEVEKRSSTLQTEVIPLITLVASKTGKAAAMSKFIESVQKDWGCETFECSLSRAILAVEGGDLSLSKKQLKEALFRVPYTEERAVYSWYLLALMSEWIYEQTGDQEFVEMALKWMKDYQVIHPIHSWAYSFEAKYSRNSDDRLRAIGIASYMDADSEWLKDVTDVERSSSEEWMRVNGPFSIREEEGSQTEG